MCGICGAYDPAGATLESIRQMANVLRHRGPDDEGYHVEGPVALGHRRLSIIDLEGGRQPISNEDGSLWIVFNGEIYNYRELRADLETRGHRFTTRTDTETVLHLYEELGERCVDRLRGMFAFAIWDAPRQRLFLARDRLGQKPLFYSHSGARFLFASEVKGLLADSSFTAQLDSAALYGYLALRFVPSPRTMFKGISALPPAHTLTFEAGAVRVKRYWDLQYRPKWEHDEAELADELDRLLRETVRCHLVSDVPVGAFLSGGIDSSLMTAYVAQENGTGIPTFSIGSESADFNELPAAHIVAERFDTDHHEEVVHPDLVALLPEMVHALDMPGDPIAACQYHVARLASKHVKVAVGGDGGDELFAGYDRMAGFKFISLYALLPTFVRTRMIGPILQLLSDSFTYKSTVSKLRWLHSLSYHKGGERYAEATTYFRFDNQALRELCGATFQSRLTDEDVRRPIIEAFDAADADEVVDRMLYADATTRLPEHLLILLDRMTMAHSLEGRSPLLDHEVAEFAARLPSRLKINGGTLKYLERQVADRHLPTEITDRPKQGFMFPIAYWLKNELRDASRELLTRSRFVEEGLFRAEPIAQLLSEHQAGQVDHHHRLWMLLNLEVWWRHYLDDRSVDSLVEELRRGTRDASYATAVAG